MEVNNPNGDTESHQEFTAAGLAAELLLHPAAPAYNENRESTRHRTERLLPVTYSSEFGGEVVVSEVRATVSPEEVADHDVPVFYAHGVGWSREPTVLTEIATTIGRSAFSMRFTGHRRPEAGFRVGQTGPGEDMDLTHVEDAQTVNALIKNSEVNTVIPDQWVAAATSLLEILKLRGGAPVDAIGQSRDLGLVLVAALEKPEAFRNIVMAYPGGIGGPHNDRPKVISDTIAGLRSKPHKIDSFKPPRGNRTSAVHSLYKEVTSPNFLTTAAALRYSALAPVLHTIREKENPPGVTLLAGLDDKIFPWERYFETLISPTDVDAIIFVPGSHGINGQRPVLEELLQQFPLLEALKREKQTQPLPPLRERVFLPANISAELKERILSMADAVGNHTN